jgi:trk system potassium uptake protein TrkH
MNLGLRIVLHVLGLLLMLNGAFMWLCLPATFYYHTADLWPILISGAITMGTGFAAWALEPSEGKAQHQET